MSERKRIAIPDNAAGRRAFEVFRSIGNKIWDRGDEVTGSFALTNFPDSETVRAMVDSTKRQFQRVVKTSDGEFITIIYDYVPQTVSAAHSLREKVAEIDAAENRKNAQEIYNAIGAALA